MTTLIPMFVVALLFTLFYHAAFDHNKQQHIITVLITFLGLGIGLIIHYFLSRKIYRPINKLRRNMKHVLNNTFEIPIQITSTGELGVIEAGCAHLQTKIINTLHELNQHIETATSDLQQSHELLEEKNIQLLLDKRKSEEKHKQKSALISNMSHEIRTPMNGIIGFANLLLEGQLGPLEHDYAKTIKSSAQDLLSIINDLLDYSKIDACKLQLDAIPLDIRSCIDDVLALNAPTAHKKGLDLIPSTAIHVPQTVLGDPLRLKQIISNLISNAIKFTEKGYVLVRTTIDQETDKDYTLCLSVTDTGIGITPEEQTNLFHPFHQADTSIARRYGGSGLGLVICKQLAEHMNGKLTFISEPNKGTTFSVHIKLEKLTAYEVEKAQTHRFGHLTVLCFDDNPLHLEAICNGLGFWGITCIRVHAFSQLEQAFLDNPHCQLAFINVNQGCEEQVTPLLHKQTIPCVLLSKWFIPDFAALGAARFLFKPPNIHKLQETIDALINPTTPATPTTPELSALDSLRKKLRSIRPNLLIADDNPVNRMLFYSWLSTNACIDVVDDGDQAVALCSQKRFDAILLDLQMPNLNGLLATRLIREKSTINRKTPILLISANSQDIHPFDLKKTGIDCHLTKPIDEKSLIEHLLTVLSHAKTNTIDWSLCVQKMSGNESLAREFLVHFIDELKLNKIELIQHMQNNDRESLEKIAHKLHGACCFFGAPLLQKHVANLEYQALHAENQALLKIAFSTCIDHIDAVLNESLSIIYTSA